MSQISALAPAVVGGIAVDAIGGFSPDKLAALSAQQADALTGAQIASLDIEHIVALTAADIGSFNATQLAALSAADIAALAPDRIGALSPAQIASLSPDQVASLTGAQTATLSPNQLAAFAPAQFATLNGAALQALSTPQLQSLSGAQLAALSPNQISYEFTNAQIQALLPAQIGALTGAQLATLSSLGRLGLFSTAQLGALSNNQIPSLDPQGVRNLSADQFAVLAQRVAAFTDAQLGALTYAETSSLAAVQFASLSSEQLSALATNFVATTIDQWNALSDTQIGGLSANALAQLPNSFVRQLSARLATALSPSQFSAFTPQQLGNFTAAYIRSKEVAFVQALSPAQIAGLNGNLEYLDQYGYAALSPDQIAAFTPGEQARYLLADQVTGWNQAQIDALTPAARAQIQPDVLLQLDYQSRALALGFDPSLLVTKSAYEVRTLVQTTVVDPLTPDQIAALDPSFVGQFTFLTFNSLSAYQFTGLTAAQLQAIPAQNFFLPNWFYPTLTANKIAALSTDQIAQLHDYQIDNLTPSAVAGFTATQLAALNTQQIGAFTTAEIPFLTRGALAALTSPQVSGFSAANLGALSADQLAAFTPNALNGFSPAQLAALSSTQIGGLVGTQIAGLQPGLFATLSNPQLAALNIDAINGVTVSQIGALTPTQLGAFSATQAQQLLASLGGFLTTDQLITLQIAAGLPASQISSLTNDQIGALTALQIASLQPNQLAQLTPAQLGAFGNDQLAQFTVAQVQTFAVSQIQGLDVTKLSNGFVQALTGAQLSGLSVSQERALAVGQVQSLNADQLQTVTSPFIQGLTNTQVQSLTGDELNALGAPQLQALTNQQVGALTLDQVHSLDFNQRSLLTPIQTEVIGYSTALQLNNFSDPSFVLPAELQNPQALKAWTEAYNRYAIASNFTFDPGDAVGRLNANIFHASSELLVQSPALLQVFNSATFTPLDVAAAQLRYFAPVSAAPILTAATGTTYGAPAIDPATQGCLDGFTSNGFTLPAVLQAAQNLHDWSVAFEQYASGGNSILAQNDPVGVLNANVYHAAQVLLTSNPALAQAYASANDNQANLERISAAYFTQGGAATILASALPAPAPSNVQTLSTADFAALAPLALNALTTTQVQQITASQIAALTQTQLQNVSPTFIQALTAPQVRSLSVPQLQQLGQIQLFAFTADQLTSLTPSQIQFLADPQLGPAQEAVLQLQIGPVIQGVQTYWGSGNRQGWLVIDSPGYTPGTADFRTNMTWGQYQQATLDAATYSPAYQSQADLLRQLIAQGPTPHARGIAGTPGPILEGVQTYWSSGVYGNAPYGDYLLNPDGSQWSSLPYDGQNPNGNILEDNKREVLESAYDTWWQSRAGIALASYTNFATNAQTSVPYATNVVDPNGVPVVGPPPNGPTLNLTGQWADVPNSDLQYRIASTGKFEFRQKQNSAPLQALQVNGWSQVLHDDGTYAWRWFQATPPSGAAPDGTILAANAIPISQLGSAVAYAESSYSNPSLARFGTTGGGNSTPSQPSVYPYSTGDINALIQAAFANERQTGQPLAFNSGAAGLFSTIANFVNDASSDSNTVQLIRNALAFQADPAKAGAVTNPYANQAYQLYASYAQTASSGLPLDAGYAVGVVLALANELHGQGTAGLRFPSSSGTSGTQVIGTSEGTFTKADLAQLTTAQIAAIPPDQIATLTPSEIAVLTNAQLQALTTDQLRSLTSTQLSVLDATQIAALLPSQLVSLSGAQARTLSAAQITLLSTAGFAALAEAQRPIIYSYFRRPEGFNWNPTISPDNQTIVYYARLGTSGQQLYVGPDNQYYLLNHLGEITQGDAAEGPIDLNAFLASRVYVAPTNSTEAFLSSRLPVVLGSTAPIDGLFSTALANERAAGTSISDADASAALLAIKTYFTQQGANGTLITLIQNALAYEANSPDIGSRAPGSDPYEAALETVLTGVYRPNSPTLQTGRSISLVAELLAEISTPSSSAANPVSTADALNAVEAAVQAFQVGPGFKDQFGVAILAAFQSFVDAARAPDASPEIRDVVQRLTAALNIDYTQVLDPNPADQGIRGLQSFSLSGLHEQIDRLKTYYTAGAVVGAILGIGLAIVLAPEAATIGVALVAGYEIIEGASLAFGLANAAYGALHPNLNPTTLERALAGGSDVTEPSDALIQAIDLVPALRGVSTLPKVALFLGSAAIGSTNALNQVYNDSQTIQTLRITSQSDNSVVTEFLYFWINSESRLKATQYDQSDRSITDAILTDEGEGLGGGLTAAIGAAIGAYIKKKHQIPF